MLLGLKTNKKCPHFISLAREGEVENVQSEDDGKNVPSHVPPGPGL